jgi:hypothetical protein
MDNVSEQTLVTFQWSTHEEMEDSRDGIRNS